MWLLKGPFDHKDEDSLDNKLKLLKTGTTYTLTRDEHAPAGHLKLKSKQVSKDHAKFKVAQHTEDDVTKLDQVPALKLSNTRDKRPLVIKRDGEDLEIHNTADMTLKPGDYLIIGSGRRTITALWQRIVLFWRPSSKELAPATKICASIGIKLSLNFVDIITHHVIPTRDLKDDCLASLLAGAAHVTKHWVDRVFELAQLPPESNGLDHTFLLPDTSDYAPPFADESAAWAQPRLWKEDPARETLFEGLRFLIVSDGSMIEQFGANVVKCGGSYDAFSVRDGLDRWDRTIANSLKRAGKPKGNMHAALVVIVDEEDIKPALTRRWDAFVASLHTAGLKYTSSAAVRLAILDRKVKELDCFHDPDTAADSQFIPGTIAEEPSQLAPSTQSTDAPALRRRAPRGATTPAESQATEPPAEQMQPVPAARRGTKRTRAESAAPEPEEPQPKRVSRRTRAGSAAPEPAPAPPPPPPEPAAEEEEDIFAPPKRPLRTRRTKPTLLTGLDGDPSVVEATQPDPPPARAAAPVPENENEPVFRPLLSLKRRAAGRTQSRGGGFSLRIGDDDEEEDSSQAAADEPPLKKFRALFEGTEDPSTSAGASGHASFAVTQTQPPTTQSQSQRPLAPSVGTSKGTTQLSAVMELDEDGAEVSRELPLTAGTSDTGTKRRRDEDGDVEMADAMPPPAAKKRKETQTQASQAAVALSEKDKKGGAKGKTGAVGGVLSAADKNDKVLTALASLKKGKRTEDNFDREFNALRISKPESDHERRAREEDEFFAHFDFEEGLRGKKCIEVREYVLPERQRADGPEREASTGAGRGPLGMWKPAWEGAPNYKKFKKVVGGAATAEARNSGGGRVELVCPEEKDFGMGSTYWSRPSGASQSQSQSQSQMDDSFGATQQRGKLRLPDFGGSDSDDDATSPPPPPTKARGGRSQASQPTSKKPVPKKKSTPLFINDDDEDEDDPVPTMDVDDDAPSTLAATLTQTGKGARVRAATQNKKTVVVVDSDSDDGMTFKSFKKQTNRR